MNAKAANPGANASASDPRRAPRDGAGRPHSRRKAFAYCVFVAILLGGGFALHERAERRAEARDRELAERLAGPLLPGVPDTGEPLWNVSLTGKNLASLFIRGVARETLGADLIRQTAPPWPDPLPSSSVWLVGAGTPTESRFFERLRTDPEIRDAWENPGRHASYEAFIYVDGTATNLLPNQGEPRVDRLMSDGAGVRERLLSALDAESAREDVSFAEERLTAGVTIFLSNWTGSEKPGRFRRAVEWCCKQLDFLPLDSLADWAAEERTSPADPTFPLTSQILSLVVLEGQAAPCRMHQGENGTLLRQLDFAVDASAALAASLQALVAKHRPETLGRQRQQDPKEPLVRNAMVSVVFPDRVEARVVPLADARFRAFLLDLLRLLATPSPGADEPHAESAEGAEFESRAENAENAETKPHAESTEGAEFESHAESAEGAEPGPHAESAEGAE